MISRKELRRVHESLDELLDKFIEDGLVEDYIRLVDNIMRRHGFKIDGEDEVGS